LFALSKLSRMIFFVAVAVAPLPFGSVDPPAIALLAVALGAVAVTASTRALNARQRLVIWVTALLIAAVTFESFEQSHSWIGSVDPIWSKAAGLLEVQITPIPSIVRDQPWYSAGIPLCCALSFLCAFIICAEPGHGVRLMQIFAWSGAVYATFGIVSFLIDPGKVLWLEKQKYRTELTGTFLNRNTAAAYFGCCTIVWLLLIVRDLDRWRTTEGFNGPHLRAPITTAAFTIMPVITIMAMFLTASRGGVVISLIAMAMAIFLLLTRFFTRRGGVVTAVSCSAVGVFLVLLLAGAGINERFNVQGAVDSDRLETYRSAIRMIAKRPWLGTGLGTFPWAFPAYRSSQQSMWGVWDRAHNTLLETAVDMGLPTAAMLFIAWLLVLGTLLKNLSLASRDAAPTTAAFLLGFVATTHSLIDFSLQIPGFAVPLFSIVGAGLARSLSE
jgi:O-antigen ligase